MSDKTTLIRIARQAAMYYHEHLERRRTLVYCADGFDLEIRWPAEGFAHLTGLNYFRDSAGRIPAPARLFYADLLHAARIGDSRVGYVSNSGYAKDKSDVLLRALDLDNAREVLEMMDGNFAVAIAGTDYLLGLMEDEKLSGESRMVVRPKSLLKKRTGVRFSVTARHTIDRVLMMEIPTL